MKNWNLRANGGPVASVLLAAAVACGTGCVTYVEPTSPAVVAAPEPPPAPMEPAPAPYVPPAPPIAVEPPPAPPPAPVVMLRSAAELDRMLAPIALYPDPLLAQLLPAATLPEQVVLADRFLREGGSLAVVDAQPWDNSLKALARYPTTLRMLDDNLAWTTDLGQAFVNQPADVMNAVQRLRAEARAIGNLVSTPQQNVVVDEGVIEILPAMPETVFVPVYQPEVVYVQPPPAPGRIRISFGVGLMIGAWLNHDCDWHHHDVIVWHHNNPRPADWWSRPPARRDATVINHVTVVNNTTVNRNVTVWHPPTHNAVADRGDRGWGAHDTRGGLPIKSDASRIPPPDGRQARVVETHPPVQPPQVHPEPPRQPQPPPQRPTAREPDNRKGIPREPARPPVVQTPAPRDDGQRNPAPPREPAGNKPPVVTQPNPAAGVHPIPAPKQNPSTPEHPAPRTTPPLLAKDNPPSNRPSQPLPAPKNNQPTPAPGHAVTPPPAARPQPTAPQQPQRPVITAPQRPVASALAGIDNPRVTREASNRGQQSQQAIAKPAPAAHPAPAPVPAPKANSEPNRSQKAR